MSLPPSTNCMKLRCKITINTSFTLHQSPGFIVCWQFKVINKLQQSPATEQQAYKRPQLVVEATLCYKGKQNSDSTYATPVSLTFIQDIKSVTYLIITDKRFPIFGRICSTASFCQQPSDACNPLSLSTNTKIRAWTVNRLDRTTNGRFRTFLLIT